MRRLTSILFSITMALSLSLTACAQNRTSDQNSSSATSTAAASTDEASTADASTIQVDGNPAHYDLSAYPLASDKVQKSEAQWKATLSAAQYDVLRDEGTERPFTGALLKEHEPGIFKCAACGNPVFASQTKFESGTGWPSFWAPIEKGRVSEVTDNSLGMSRTEIKCLRCGSHLGHVFDDGPKPTGLRYCMNSVALSFDKKQ